MDIFKTEGVTALTLYILLALVLIISLFMTGKFNPKTELYMKKILGNWRIAAVITAIYLICSIIGTGFHIVSLVWSVGLFCQAIVAVTIARNLDNFTPFPFMSSIKQKTHIRSVLMMLGISFFASIVIMVTSSLSMGIGQMLGEKGLVYESVNNLSSNGIQTFFALLAGAGILEGVTYRLLTLSLILKLTKKRWLAIILSAVIFAIYHFTPLNVFYRVFWQVPITQFVSVLFGGTIIGYLYIKRGFATSVLAHTLADWLPLILFASSVI